MWRRNMYVRNIALADAVSMYHGSFKTITKSQIDIDNIIWQSDFL